MGRGKEVVAMAKLVWARFVSHVRVLVNASLSMVMILRAALVNAKSARLAGSIVLVLAEIIVWKDVVVVMTARVRSVGALIVSVHVKMARFVIWGMNVTRLAFVC